MTRVTVVLAGALALAWSGVALAQAPAPGQHIVGDRISGQMQIDGKAGMVTETATLTFQNGTGGEVYTIDFIARHPVRRPVAAPGAVDIVVTQHPVEDAAPEMTLRVDGEAVPVVTRLHSRRSVVATVSLAELDRIASAGSVVERTFDAELEFGPGQVRMLRATADRWLDRVR
jgi:hypothetical protein